MYRFTITSRVFAAILFVSLTAFSCSDNSSGPDENNPQLSEKEQQMVGVWLLVRTEEGPNPGEVNYGTFKWTFKKDGSGKYYQNPDGGAQQTTKFDWSIDDEDNIVFSDDSGTESRNYRVEEYGENSMRWYNYTSNDIYIVERQ